MSDYDTRRHDERLTAVMLNVTLNLIQGQLFIPDRNSRP